MNLKDFRVDQCKRYDHRLLVAHNEFYLGDVLACLQGKGEGDVSHSRRPSKGNCIGATTQKGRRAREFLGRRDQRGGLHL